METGKMHHEGGEKCMWCSGHGWHSGKYWVLRWIILIIILLVVFSLGVKVGYFKAILGGYGKYGGYGYYEHPMMGGYYGGYGPMMNGGWYGYPQQAPTR